MITELTKSRTFWTLQGRPDLTGPVEVINVEGTSVRVGRCGDVTLRINRPTISSVHAEVFERDGQLWLRDFDSTNGSYVNGTPVKGEVQLERGDLIQFADVAFRVDCADSELGRINKTVATSTYDEALSLVQFDRLMQHRSVIPHFQPIVALPSLDSIGFEVLGRSRHYGLESPKDMFLAASQLNQEGELSELLRYVGTREGEAIDGDPKLFLNTHPVELVTCGLLDSLGRLRELHPPRRDRGLHPCPRAADGFGATRPGARHGHVHRRRFGRRRPHTRDVAGSSGPWAAVAEGRDRLVGFHRPDPFRRVPPL